MGLSCLTRAIELTKYCAADVTVPGSDRSGTKPVSFPLAAAAASAARLAMSLVGSVDEQPASRANTAAFLTTARTIAGLSMPPAAFAARPAEASTSSMTQLEELGAAALAAAAPA